MYGNFVFAKTLEISDKVYTKLVNLIMYYLRLAIGRALQEPELSFYQKLRFEYILSGTRFIRSPKGYFSRKTKKLKIIDDVADIPHAFWMNHLNTDCSPPLITTRDVPETCKWQTPQASFILKVTDGFVAPDGLVFNSYACYRNAKWYYKPLPDYLPLTHFDRLITFLQLWSNGFVHFSFDTLPRINLAYDMICQEQDIKILIPDRPFIFQLFDTLDIDPKRIVIQKGDHVYSANIVYYPHFYSGGRPHKMGLIPIGGLDKVREKISGPFSHADDHVLYLKRNDNGSRSVENETELFNSIQKHLRDDLIFRIFQPDNDWRKDKEVMKRARVVLGPHGGAWSNIIFCKEGTDVVEFIPLVTMKEKGVNERPCYYGLSNALKLKYWCIEPENFEFDNSKVKMRVHVEDLLSVLRKIGVTK